MSVVRDTDGASVRVKQQWVIIGISGVTCGGKTTLANKLRDKLTPSYIFHQDKYFYPDDSPHHIRCGNLPHNNYDILSALDMDTMYKDVCLTMEGVNRAHGYCDTGDIKVEGKKFLIVEGFTVLNYKPILELCDLRYYFVLSYEDCISRRILRLYDPPDIEGYFETCVWPEHLNYKAEIEKDRRIKQLDATKQDALDIVLNDIRNINIK